MRCSLRMGRPRVYRPVDTELDARIKGRGKQAMTGLKILALAGAVQLYNTIDPSTTAQAVTVSGILIVAVAALWRDSRKREAELKKVLVDNSVVIATAQASAKEMYSQNLGLLLEVKDGLKSAAVIIQGCHERTMARDVADEVGRRQNARDGRQNERDVRQETRDVEQAQAGK